MSKIDFGRTPFELKSGENYEILKFVGDQNHDLAKEFEKRIHPKLETFSTDLVIDLSECGEFHKIWIRQLMQIASTVKKGHHRLRVVTSNPMHRSFFHDQGVAALFPIVPDFATATRELATKKMTKIDVGFINPFLEGAVEVLKKQAGTEALPGTPASREPGAPIEGDISGVIGLSSKSFSGVVIISFPEETYLKLISKILGEGHDAISENNSDAASELVNMIFGHAKRVLNEKGYGLKMAIPSIVTGKDPSSFAAITGPRIAIPFKSEAGPFTIEFRVETI